MSKDGSTTGEEGIVYVASTDSTSYVVNNAVSVEKLSRLRNNVYGRGLTLKLENLVFERVDEAFIEVLSRKTYKPAENIQMEINSNFDDIDYRSKLKLAWNETVWLGKGIFNHTWRQEDNKTYINELRHLPSRSFNNPPPNVMNEYTDLLKGIYYNVKTKQKEYWQTTNNLLEGLMPAQLNPDYIIEMGDPAHLDIAGDPIIRPLVPVLEMMSYVWTTEMQRVNRVGAPFMFIKITKPQAANEKNGNVSDIDYAKRIMQYTSKNNSYPLRENMEIVWPDFKESTSTTDVIYTLTHLLMDYCTPVGFVSKEGRLISHNTDDSDIYWAYTKGQHRWLELALQPLIDMWLKFNGYDKEYIAYLKFPKIGRTKAEIMLRQAELIARTRGGSIHEFRERLELAAKDDATLETYAQQWAKILPDPRALDKDKAMLPTSGLINEEDLRVSHSS